MTIMLPPASRSYRSDLLLAFILFAGAYFTYSSYVNFFNAGWTFDDERVFSSLSGISDSRKALDFITDPKEISQIGRPVALASFLLNITDWPTNPGGFRRINALIHVINGLLLALVVLRVAREIPGLCKHAAGFAMSVSIAWLLHPFLASTSFHVIQRMTILATTFSLLCFLAYLHGRALLLSHLYRGLSWMTFSLLIPGTLALLSKETAVLTPLLMAVLELIILNRYSPIDLRAFRLWRLFFFGVPAVLLFAFAVYYLLVSAQGSYFFRPFTLSERLLSESIILFDYLRQILLPNISTMGPFQDDTSRILGLSLFTFAAIAFWVVITIMAISKRRQMPLFSFAVLFFLVGHLLESTFFGLELYFEHRNYLPSTGLIAALFAIAWIASTNWPKIIIFLYISLLGGLLWSLSTLWGHPILGPIAWAKAHPTSVRATQVLTTMYWKLGQVDQAKEIILNGYKTNPNDSNLATNALTYQCFGDESQTSKELTENIINRAPTLGYGRSVTAGLYATFQLISEGRCDRISPNQAIRFTQGLLENPRFVREDERKALYLLISRFADLDNNPTLSVEAKSRAFLIEPWTGGMVSIYCKFLDLKNPDAASTFLRVVGDGTLEIDCMTQRSAEMVQKSSD